MFIDINLLLDDVRDETMTFNASGNTMYLKLPWIIVRNYDEFIEYITKNGIPKLISFDHDLEDIDYDSNGENYSERTGKECAEWLVDYCMTTNHELPEIAIHSSNWDGRRRIQSVFDTYNKLKERGIL